MDELTVKHERLVRAGNRSRRRNRLGPVCLRYIYRFGGGRHRAQHDESGRYIDNVHGGKSL